MLPDQNRTFAYFAKAFMAALDEFKSTSQDKPNIYVRGWPNDPDNPAESAEVTGVDLYHRPWWYGQWFEIQSGGGLITYLLHIYLKINLLLIGHKFEQNELLYYGDTCDILPRRMYQMLFRLSDAGYWLDLYTADREIVNTAHDLTKVIFRVLYRNLDYYQDDLERHICYGLERLSYSHITSSKVLAISNTLYQ